MYGFVEYFGGLLNILVIACYRLLVWCLHHERSSHKNEHTFYQSHLQMIPWKTTVQKRYVVRVSIYVFVLQCDRLFVFSSMSLPYHHIGDVGISIYIIIIQYIIILKFTRKAKSHFSHIRHIVDAVVIVVIGGDDVDDVVAVTSTPPF